METRQMRGKEIAQTMGNLIKKTEDGWLVPSQTTDEMYKVNQEFVCSCPDCQKRGVTCKHAYAVRYYLQTEKETPHGITTERVQISYPQAWKAYNEAQTHEITLFDELLKDLVQEVEEPAYSFGRPRLSRKDVVFCCVQKAYSTLSSRRAVSLFGNAAAKSQIGHKPHFTSVNGYLRDEDLTPILHRLIAVTAAPLRAVETDFAVDSTGFRTTCFGQYAEQKYDLERSHKWLKAHACVGVKTNIVTGIEITKENGADVSQFPVLVQKTAQGGFTVSEVSADKAYLSRDNLQVVADLGGTAYIPFKSNTTGKAVGSLLWKKAYYFFQLHADEFYEHYHKRSNVESTFAAIKKKFGDGLKTKTDTAQRNELLCKLVAYNITVLIQQMFELGITPDFKAEQKVGDLNKKEGKPMT